VRTAKTIAWVWVALAVLPVLNVRGDQTDQAAEAKAIEFFESKVRPILAEHCFSCHGPKKQMGGGLRVDSRASMLKGGDSGPIIVPGKPEQSPMIRAILYGGDIKMPPKTKLPSEAVETLTAWVKLGAPWPDTGGNTATAQPSVIAEAAKKHWAFQPVRKPQSPAVKNEAWVRTPVDRFILAKLEAKQIASAPPADRRTLVRRLSFDLIGLPPTPEEIEATLSDKSDEWYEKLVNRLLASPQYGERWARHWLDVARYADTKGYLFLEERRFPYSYAYRDYVIRSFNEDLPYDQFIVQQLAADLLPRGDDPRSLAAMGYLTLGRRFLNNTHDIIDDRIDVVSRGFQGLTVTCARCHDHKFDPIPTNDYYSLYGVFNNSVEPKELPLIGDVQRTAEYLAWEKELQAREQKVREFVDQKYAELVKTLRLQVGDYLLAVRKGELLPGEDHYEALNPGDLNPEIVRRWKEYLAQTRRQHHPIFAAWHAFAALPQKEFKEKARPLAEKLAANADVKERLNPHVARLFADKAPETLQDVARAYGELLKAIEKEWLESQQGESKPAALPDGDREALRQVLYAPTMPINVPLAEVRAKRIFDRDTRSKLGVLERKVEEWKANSAVLPPRAMVLNDRKDLVATRVLVRGNPNNQGDVVSRQFLAILTGPERKPFKSGSGRLELAQAIASKSNPLTARVMVNRVWGWHFGAGLVRTPSDFGLRGEPPTHPELLDYLATYFMDNGWSLKKLHRQIVLSNTYRQAIAGDPRLATLDADNRLLARMNRRRLDFEQMRDSLLAAGGKLDLAAGGPSTDLTKTPFSQRRTIYGFIERQNLPGMFRTFDFASPDTSSPQRYTTTVPQQALFLMNSPFVVEQAKRLAARPEIANEADAARRVERLYRLCYGRAPEAEELSLALQFVTKADKPDEGKQNGVSLSAWEKYTQVLLLSNEFAFVD
jgi:mono/diheme cytochrome c family protein